MDTTSGFTTFFLLTLVALGAAAYSGKRALRKVHITCVVVTTTLLGITIYYAKELGEIYDLEAAGWITPVHLMIAKVATLVLVVAIGSGLFTLKNYARLAWHKRIAWAAILLTTIAAVTGTWMILGAEPLG